MRRAIETDDPATLERKIDFPRVRENLKPLVAAEVSRSVDRLQRDTGALGAAIADQIKGSLGAQLAQTAIDSILTPVNVIRMVKQGTDLRRAIAAATGRDRGRDATRGKDSAEAPAPATPEAKTEAQRQERRLSSANIRSYSLKGPLTIAVGLARDPKATAPDLTVDLAFTGGDWRVVGLTPRLD